MKALLSRGAIALFGSAALALAVIPTAHAAPTAKADFPTLKVSVVKGVLKIQGDQAKNALNDGVVLKAKRDERKAYIGTGAAIAGPGCSVGTFTENMSAGRPEDRWEVDNPTYQAVCDLTGVTSIDITLGAGNDSVDIVLTGLPISIDTSGSSATDDDNVFYRNTDINGASPPYSASLTVDTGPGRDNVLGGPAADNIQTGPGIDHIDGACGADTINSGAGNDQVLSGDTVDFGCARAQDTVNCGDGSDILIRDSADTYKGCEAVSYAW